jgi:hypothetical protein
MSIKQIIIEEGSQQLLRGRQHDSGNDPTRVIKQDPKFQHGSHFLCGETLIIVSKTNMCYLF